MSRTLQTKLLNYRSGTLLGIKNNPDTFKRKHTNNYSESVYTIERIDGLGYRLEGKRRKYFISELKLVKDVDEPELIEPEDINKPFKTNAQRFAESQSEAGKARAKLRLEKILKRLN